MGLPLQQLSVSGARGEKIDTARTLLVAEFLAEMAKQGERVAGEFVPRWPLERLCEIVEVPQHNDLPRIDRAREMLAVWAFYPREFLEFAYEHPPHWHKLVEPTRWGEDRDVVVSFFRDHITTSGNWPSVGNLRAKFGRTSNHTPPEPAPGQEQIGGLA